MKLLKESALIKKGDKGTLKMLDLWHELSIQHFDYFIEVVIGDRNQNRNFMDYKGDFNTAYPVKIENIVSLILWLEEPEKLDEIIITHEVGHFVLKLQGFSSMIRRGNMNSDEEIMLNSLCHHSALYQLQRTMGLQPQPEIDSRAAHNIHIVRKNSQTLSDSDFWKILLLVDGIHHASPYISKHILKSAKRFQPSSYIKIRAVTDILNKYNLLKAEEVLSCSQNIVEKLKMGSNWESMQDIEELRSAFFS